MKMIALNCPSCNGELEVEDGLDTFFCKYCLVYGDKKELLFNVMKIDEMEREDEVCIDDYFLTDKALIKYNRFLGNMLSELIVFCEAIFAFLLTEATISDVNKCVLDIVQCSKRIFTVGDESDKQTILEKILLGLLEKTKTNVEKVFVTIYIYCFWRYVQKSGNKNDRDCSFFF